MKVSFETNANEVKQAKGDAGAHLGVVLGVPRMQGNRLEVQPTVQVDCSDDVPFERAGGRPRAVNTLMVSMGRSVSTSRGGVDLLQRRNDAMYPRNDCVAFCFVDCRCRRHALALVTSSTRLVCACCCSPFAREGERSTCTLGCTSLREH